MPVAEAAGGFALQSIEAMESRKGFPEPPPAILEIPLTLLSPEVGLAAESERVPTPPVSLAAAGVQLSSPSPAGPSAMADPSPGMAEVSMAVLPHASVTLDAELVERLLDFILQF